MRKFKVSSLTPEFVFASSVFFLSLCFYKSSLTPSQRLKFPTSAGATTTTTATTTRNANNNKVETDIE